MVPGLGVAEVKDLVPVQIPKPNQKMAKLIGQNPVPVGPVPEHPQERGALMTNPGRTVVMCMRMNRKLLQIRS
jgi:hypothetical protein